MGIAIGNDFPDALTGSIYAAKLNAPMILADGKLKENTKQYLLNKKSVQITIFDVNAVVSKSIEDELAQILK